MANTSSRRGIFFIRHRSTRIPMDIKISGTSYKTRILGGSFCSFNINNPGGFSISLGNENGQYNDVFSENEEIVWSWDWPEKGTPQERFGGYIKKVDYVSGKIPSVKLTGLDFSGKAKDIIINKVYTTATDIGTIIQELLSEYLPTYTYTNVSTTGVTLTPSFSDISLYDAIRQVIKQTGNLYSIYCDKDKDWHLVKKGSSYNRYCGAFRTKNLRRVAMNSDINTVFNKIRLYGKQLEGIPKIKTVSDATSISANEEMQKVVRNSTLSTDTEMNETADSILDIVKDNEYKGTGLVSPALLELNPGDQIYIFSPKDNIQGFYIIPEFTHTISKTGFNTTFKFQELRKGIISTEDILSGIYNASQSLLDTENPYDMENSLVFNFLDSSYIYSLSNCEISSDEFLSLTTGQSSAEMVSISSDEQADKITQAHFKVVGESLGACTFSVTVGGITQRITHNEKINITGTGKSISITTNLGVDTENTNPRIKAIGVLYK